MNLAVVRVKLTMVKNEPSCGKSETDYDNNEHDRGKSDTDYGKE